MRWPWDRRNPDRSEPIESPHLGIPQLTVPQLVQLAGIERTHADGPYPCRAVLADGRVEERVLVQSISPIVRYMVKPSRRIFDNIYPQISPADVAQFSASEHRLPVGIARQIQRAGESGMGYFLFVLEFSDGSRVPYTSDGGYHFLEFPEGKGPEDVVAVKTHTGRMAPHKRTAARSVMCFYSGKDP
jgi:hypothetical protein